MPHLSTIVLNEVQLAPAGVKTPTEITIRIVAQGRAEFGEKFRVTLVPHLDD